MNLSRRHLLSGGFAGLGVLGVSALTGCSTSTEPKSDTGAGDAKKLVLWMWPEGFDKQTLATVAKAQPSYNVRQDIIGGDLPLSSLGRPDQLGGGSARQRRTDRQSTGTAPTTLPRARQR